MTANRTRQVSLVMIITIFSKCLGFLRDIVLAKYFGAGAVTDSYFVAQVIPEALFILVVQSVSVGFIPIYTKIYHDRGKEESDFFVDNILKISLLLTILLVLFVNLFPGQILSIFASGFDKERVEFTISFVRISVFAMFFRITVAIYSAYLHANNQFVGPAFNGIVLDLAVITSIIVAFYTKSVVLAYGVVASALVQFLLLLPMVRKRRSLMSFSPIKFNDDVKQMLLLFLPLALGVGANQLNVIADRTMASSIHGAISSLKYAERIDNVLEHIIIFSVATVMFPVFSKNIAANNIEAFRSNVAKSMNVVTFTMLPCSIFAIIFSKDIISLLFGRGAFDSSAVENVSVAMKYYSVGLLCLSYNVILKRAFYALKKVKLVSVVSIGTLVSNVLMNFLLKPIMGIGGLALATSISNIFATTLLMSLIYKDLEKAFFKSIFTEFLRIALPSGMMAFTVYVACSYVEMSYFLSLGISLISGVVVFFFSCYVTKSLMMKELLRLIADKLHMKKSGA